MRKKLNLTIFIGGLTDRSPEPTRQDFSALTEQWKRWIKLFKDIDSYPHMYSLIQVFYPLIVS